MTSNNIFWRVFDAYKYKTKQKWMSCVFSYYSNFDFYLDFATQVLNIA